MTYAELVLEAVRPDLLQGLLLLPDELHGRLFRQAVSYLAGDRQPEPLPPALIPAWERFQPRLDADVKGQASLRAALHGLAANRLWYLRALPAADAGRLASAFVCVLLRQKQELAPGTTTREVHLQAHFRQAAASLQGTLRDLTVQEYRRIREAVEKVSGRTPLTPEEEDYLTGCLYMVSAQEKAGVQSAQVEIRDAELLAALLAARTLLTGGSEADLDMEACRRLAAESLGLEIPGQTESPAAGSAEADSADWPAEEEAAAPASGKADPEESDPAPSGLDWGSDW